MTEENPLKRISLKNPIHFLAVGLGSGLLHPAPGTWGSALGTLLGVILLALLGTKIFLIFTALCFVLGCYLCQKTADDMGVHDHGSIVWDEFVGVFIVLAAIPTLSLPWILTAFGLFRFFDILKPFPIRFFDKKLESGFGIMIDDVLAAIYGVAVIFLIQMWR
ncbi:phosphatidylglycerophosphatase A family protein [Rodentibacter trehalosifermentans]|uniref:phosphatidylglycerophosphatase A family protein n=1 Tax=Rodentibacter trehalosifermentans TaxID=1908263 RepID=UPI000985FE0C|nr:phosphatidylglycerophosphatase A [Rodentibacter trehalosifermentans]OOF53672.1 phosphatidylglycerophosphatase A [Rodentibacter trehalosifermentans]